MRTFRDILLLSACFACTPACTDDGGDDTGGSVEPWTGDGEAGEFTLDLTVDDVDRELYFYAPDSAVDVMPDGPVPLFFALHGAGDTGEHFVTAAGLTDLADENGFLVVGPDAIRKAWFLQASEGWDSPDGQSSSIYNDLDFMIGIVDLVAEDYHVDTDRIFTAGFSRGAGMSGLLATASGQVETASGTYVSPYAAHAVSAGFDVFGGGLDLSDTEPKNPIWLVHGTDDTAVPYSYGESFAQDLEDAGWDVTFTTVEGAPHNWLFQAGYGQDNQDLWDWFMASAD